MKNFKEGRGIWCNNCDWKKIDQRLYGDMEVSKDASKSGTWLRVEKERRAMIFGYGCEETWKVKHKYINGYMHQSVPDGYLTEHLQTFNFHILHIYWIIQAFM